MRRFFISALAIVVIVAMGAPAAANPGRNFKACAGGHPVGQLIRDLPEMFRMKFGKGFNPAKINVVPSLS